MSLEQKKNRTYGHVPTMCPGCGQPINATSDPKDRGMPKPNDLTVAICCGTILRFDHRLRLRIVTPGDLYQLPEGTREELKEQQDRYRAFKGEGKIISLPPRKPN